jgi:hypothetical protein
LCVCLADNLHVNASGCGCVDDRVDQFIHGPSLLRVLAGAASVRTARGCGGSTVEAGATGSSSLSSIHGQAVCRQANTSRTTRIVRSPPFTPPNQSFRAAVAHIDARRALPARSGRGLLCVHPRSPDLIAASRHPFCWKRAPVHEHPRYL